MFYLGFLFCLFPSFVSDNNSSNDDDDNVFVSCVSVDTSEPRKCTGDREITHIYRSSSSLVDGTCRRGYAINFLFRVSFFFLSSFHHLIGIRSCVDFLKVLSCSVYRNLLLRCVCMYVCECVYEPIRMPSRKGERERKTGKLSTKYVVHSGTLDGI